MADSYDILAILMERTVVQVIRERQMRQMRGKTQILLFVILLCAIFPTLRVSAVDGTLNQESIELTEAEQEFVDSGREIVIGCPIGNCPLLFEEEATGELKGITIDILNMVSESTGLRFRYVALPAENVTYKELERLQVDLVSSVELNDMNRDAKGIMLSEPYLQTEKIFVCKKGVVLDPDKESVIAVASGSQTLSHVIRQIYPNFQVDYYDSMEEALAAVMDGRADAVLQNQYTLQRILAKPIYENLRVVEAAAIGDFHCLAAIVPIDADGQNIADEEDTLMLSVLNKGITALNKDRVSFVIIKETAENVYHFKMEDFVYRYRYAIVLMAASLILILILIWQIIVLRKRREEQMAAEHRAKELAVINEQMREQQVLLEEALVRAEAGNQAKNTFLFNMSHDIRTPMNAIMGFTSIALDSKGDEDTVQDSLEKIYESACNLLQLMNNVLDMSSIESGKITLLEEPCDLIGVFTKAQELLKADIEKKQLTVNTDISDMKSSNVYCDTLHLNQIFFNLLSNAVKFSEEGGMIDVAIHQDEPDIHGKAKYRIHVKDNGIGMSEEFQKHVFETFERERTSTDSGMQGAGLGLSITKGLVELMGGTIEISSKLKEGTECVLSFVFRLQENEYTAKQPEVGQEPLERVDFTGKRLLLVEDNELNAEIAENILSEEGFLVDIAENGKVAVEKVKNSSAGYYEMILMDIQMPVMDGYQSTREIRRLEQKELAGIPIIALTANAFEDDKRKAMESGMNAHVSKPIDVQVLMETLTRVYCLWKRAK